MMLPLQMFLLLSLGHCCCFCSGKYILFTAVNAVVDTVSVAITVVAGAINVVAITVLATTVVVDAITVVADADWAITSRGDGQLQNTDGNAAAKNVTWLVRGLDHLNF